MWHRTFPPFRKSIPTAVCAFVAVAVIAFVVAACDSKQPPPRQRTVSAPHARSHDHGAEEHHHEHTAPHGGTLIEIGEEAAHLEVLLDWDKGLLTIYMLDGEAEHPVRLSANDFQMTIEAGGEPFTLTLNAVADELTGETIGDTARFQAASEKLMGIQSFKATVKSLDMRGHQLDNFEFKFPEGNEEK